MTDLTVIVPTVNRCSLLARALDALGRQTYPVDRYQIVVVDDHSSDGTSAMIARRQERRCQGPAVIYLRQIAGRSGPSAANNLGLRAADSELVLFVNDDVIAGRELIAEHVRIHRSRPGGIVLGRIRHAASPDELDRRPRGFQEYSDWPGSAFFVTWNCSVKRQIVINAGGFDEEFVLPGWEDIELGYRLRRMGVRQRRAPAALGYHIRPDFSVASLPHLRAKTIGVGANAALFARKHPQATVRLTTQVFWLPLMLHRVAETIVRRIGSSTVRHWCERLEGSDRQRLLALVVAAARTHWYFSGLKAGLDRAGLRS
jgi:GT2 family glycosyltransferase